MKITIDVGDNGELKWSFEGEIIEQQFLEILRAIQDQILLDRAIRETKRSLQIDAGVKMQMIQNINKIKQKIQ